MGAIDFFATSVNYRGQGVATKMKEVESREPTLLCDSQMGEQKPLVLYICLEVNLSNCKVSLFNKTS